MRKLVFIVIATIVLSAGGCSRDAQASAFMKDYAAVADGIVKRLKDEDLDGAREFLDENKPKLVAKWDKIRTALPFQFTEATKKRMKADPEKNVEDVVAAANEYVKKHPRDEAQAQALALELANIFR